MFVPDFLSYNGTFKSMKLISRYRNWIKGRNKKKFNFLIPLAVFLAYVIVTYMADWFRYYIGFHDVYFYGKVFGFLLLICSVILSIFYFFDSLRTEQGKGNFEKIVFPIISLIPILFLIYILIISFF